MPNGGVLCWGWSGATWIKLLTDASGHLQVDVLSTVMDTDAATEATLADVESAVDGIEALLAGGLPSALDTDSLKVREQGTPAQHCYGWDGDTWEKMLFESTTLHNLRVKLFDGADGITSGLADVINYIPNTRQSLDVRSMHYLFRSPTNAYNERCAFATGDDQIGLYNPAASIYGWNGTNVNKLRCYAGGILKVARAEAGLSNSGVLSSDTAVKASAGKVYWMSVSDTAALSIELNDSTDGAGTDQWAAVLPADCYGHYIFDPPLEFSTGIYLDVSTATCKVVVGYL